VTTFSINLNKFALLRNARGRNMPDLMDIARRCIARGVGGITVHPRPDERHARKDDVRSLATLIRPLPHVEFNVEGFPGEDLLRLVCETRPDQCTLVPDAAHQLTSDHGWDAIKESSSLVPVVARLKASGIRVSLFLDPEPAQVDAAARTGADRIELYTESYARAFGTASEAGELARFARAARRAQAVGLGVNAGHDLNLANLGAFLAAVPHVLEVSIGHAVICEALDHGLDATLDRYLALVARRD
jgi:pyridoxine 5-phosphate synthase